MRKVLQTPIKDEDLESLNIGDVVYLTGTLVTCRDVAHRRLIELGRELPVDLKGGAIFHAGPIVRQKDDGEYEMVSIGPTTSMRMEKFEKEFNLKGIVNVINVIILPIFDISARLERSNDAPLSSQSITDINSKMNSSSDSKLEMYTSTGLELRSHVPEGELFEGFRVRIDKLPEASSSVTNLPWSMFTNVEHRIDSMIRQAPAEELQLSASRSFSCHRV